MTALFSQVHTVLSVTVQSLTFSVRPVSGLRRSSEIFSVATMISRWLRNADRTAEPACEGPRLTAPCLVRGPLLPALLERGQLHIRVGRREAKISPDQCKCFINACTRIPEGGEQHFAGQLRHVMKQRADLRSQQVLRVLIMLCSHLA